jgi:hypothetical protein
MSEANTQTVAPEAEAQATPAPEATSAQSTTPNLDDLLNEFETAAKPQSVPQAKPTVSDPVVAELQREVASMKFEREIKPILARVRGDIPQEVIGDEELTDLLDGRAKRDPRVQNAYLNRQSNPGAWAKIEKALNAEYAAKFKPRVDANATADREAVAAAVRGTSTKAPEEKPPNYGDMNDAEFRREVAKYI